MIKNYNNIIEGRFVSRPNRFIAYVELSGSIVECHVKNTGRCRELLVPDAVVYLEKADNPARKTAYDLVAVRKGDRLVNMDSQLPNLAATEWIKKGGLGFRPTAVHREASYGNSRFDICLTLEDGTTCFVEVKGVTLEEDGIVMFPDAPTERGVKHLHELASCVQEGYAAYVLFVIQMEGVRYFTPNRRTHPEFATALLGAQKAGVEIRAVDCVVTKDGIRIKDFVPIHL